MTGSCCNFKFLADISTDILLALDQNGRICRANRHAGSLWPQAEGKTLEDILPAAQYPRLHQMFDNGFRFRFADVCRLVFRERVYTVSLFPKKGNCALCFHDITENLQLAAELRQTTERLEFAEAIAKIGYWELDWKLKKMYWSAEMYRIFGVNPAEVSSKRNLISEFIFPEDLPQYKQKLQELIKQEHPVEGRLRIRRANGKIAHCFYKASVIRQNDAAKIAGTFQDLTTLVEIQQDLEQAKQAAEKSSRDKSYFLAQASHDLRQPMQALNIFIGALFGEGLNGKQCEILEKIEASAMNLNNLLSNLLDISKLDSGGIKYEPQEFNIGKLLRNISAEYAELACCRHIKFHALLHNGDVYSDPILIERIVRNLLSNAFKYTRSKIVLGCKKEKSAIRIMVLDNGPGIPQSELSKIFEEFYQSPHIADNRKNGAGLGLTIVSKIAAIINTRIEISTIPGRGSCFSFLLPLLQF